MALRIWLPLNGNLDNKGLSSISKISGTPGFSGSKFGQCLSSGSTIRFQILDTDFIANLGESKQYSIMAWCQNLSSTASTRWVYGIGTGSGSQRGFWENNIANSCHWAFAGSGKNISCTIDTRDELWHHICFTVNDTLVTLYIDGVKQGTGTDNTVLPSGDYVTLYPNNYALNDFRLYDECLNDKEIYEISRALIAHYKLDRIYSPNSLKLGQCVTNGTWDSTNLQYKITSTVTTSGWGSGTAVKSNQLIVPYGSAYRISADVYVPSEHKIVIDINNAPISGSAWSGNDNDNGSKRTTTTFTVPANTWTTISWGSENSNASNTDQISISPYDNIGLITKDDTDSVIWYIRNIKGEVGSEVTNWIPNIADTYYSSMGYDKMPLEDCSGIGNEATNLLGDFLSTKNTIRYETCPVFNGSNTVITLPQIFPTNTTLYEFSTCAWIKTTSAAYKNILTLQGNCFFRYRPTSATTVQILYRTKPEDGSSVNTAFTCATSSLCSDLFDNKWHFICVTFSKGIWNIYIDGNVGITTDKSDVGNCLILDTTDGNDYWYIGGITSSSEVWLGNISDVRLYGTCLSTEDIKRLYTVSARVTSDSMQAYEFKEV